MNFLRDIPTWIWIALAAAVAFFVVLDAYGDSKYREGKAKADMEWKAASDKLIQKAAASGERADTAAAAREADFAARVEDEKEKIDAATADGTSPFDVMFGD